MIKSKFISLNKPGELELKEKDVPVLKNGFLLKNIACGVCGTDMHVVNGKFNTNYPIIPGHEFYGEIVDIKDKKYIKAVNGRAKIGDYITLVPGLQCNDCIYCKELPEQDELCAHRQTYGLTFNTEKYPFLGGGYSEYVVVNDGFVPYIVNKNWPLGYGVLLEPLCVANYAVERMLKIAQKTKNRKLRVAIVGFGTIGCMVALSLRDKNIDATIIEIKENRQEIAGKLNFKNIYSNDANKILSQEDLNGLPFDVVFECAGTQESFMECFSYVRKGGVIVEMGHFVNIGNVELSPQIICKNEVTIIGSVLSPQRKYKESEKILNKNLQYAELLVSPKFTLNEVNEALDNLINKKDGIKTTLIMEHKNDNK